MNKTIIIAEAGVNHNGSVDLAKRLIDAASLSGANYVKFQTFISEDCVSKNAKKAQYQIDNINNKDETQLDMIKKLELSFEDHFVLMEYCKKRKIGFLSTAFDFKSLDFLQGKLDFYKIPSGEITNLLYLEKVAKLKAPIIMSTGMANMKEVKQALGVLLLKGVNKDDVFILHCNSEYPTPMQDVNLTAMLSIKKELGVDIGYSDHTLGIEIPIAAVALGARIIEKHFTLDRMMPGPDHKASLEPEELKEMVSAIRNIEFALGDGVKKPTNSEKKNINIVRKSIVTIQPIKKGELFTDKNIGVKRPGNGISAMKWYDILGTRSSKDYKSDELV